MLLVKSRLAVTIAALALLMMLAVTLDQFLGPRGTDQAAAAEPSATGSDRPPLDPNLGDTKPAPARAWDSSRDLPPQIANDKSVAYDYPIVYVRVPRPYPKEYYNINHLTQAGLHQTNAPGAELRILYPDGRDESLVSVAERESIADPMVSFDGQTVFFAKYHHMNTGATASMTQVAKPQGGRYLQDPRPHAQTGADYDARAHAQYRRRARGN